MRAHTSGYPAGHGCQALGFNGDCEPVRLDFQSNQRYFEANERAYAGTRAAEEGECRMIWGCRRITAEPCRKPSSSLVSAVMFHRFFHTAIECQPILSRQRICVYGYSL